MVETHTGALPPGCRLTRQRRAILAALQSTTSHPDVRWLHSQVRRELPGISLTSVYRNLEMMARTGVIQQIASRDSAARFDANTRLHGHIQCLRCSRIDDVPLPAAVSQLRELGPSGYEDVRVKLEFDGVCPECASRDV